MAHSFVQAHERERDAFEAFARSFPQSTMLVDTYDTLGAVATVIRLATQENPPLRIAAIRIDSGDLLALSRQARAMLDAAGLAEINIVVSGGLDEYEVERLVASGAPIDGFGVGTAMGVSDDEPALDMAYKLTEYGGVGRTKLSAGKVILPGRKQVFRRAANGTPVADVIALADEALTGQPLLELVMSKGRRVNARAPRLTEIRALAAAGLAALPKRLLSLAPADSYPVQISERLALHSAAIQNEARERARDPH
jgi:nicotinate phosphoribosyltransferase